MKLGRIDNLPEFSLIKKITESIIDYKKKVIGDRKKIFLQKKTITDHRLQLEKPYFQENANHSLCQTKKSFKAGI